MIIEIIISLLCLIFGGLFITRQCCKGTNCKVDRDMSNEVVVITGANTGIGLETAKELYKRNAFVILACRDKKRGDQAVQDVKSSCDTTTKGKVQLILLDLSDLSTFKPFVDTLKSITNYVSILVNNAGVFGILNRKTTAQGIELNVGTNHIGHAYLTELLLPMFDPKNQNRIINVSSMIIQKQPLDLDKFNLDSEHYNAVTAYANSKVANVLHALYLNKQYSSSHNLKAVSLHPGVISTEIIRNLQENKLFNFAITYLGGKRIYDFISKTPLEGAQTTIFCCLEGFKKLQGGKYYQDCKIKGVNATAVNQKEAEKLQSFTQKLIKQASISQTSK